LRIETGVLGVKLLPKLAGGSVMKYDASINNEPGHVPYVTPIYVREGINLLFFFRLPLLSRLTYQGSIIPQLEVRQWIGDTGEINPFTIHVYPGKATVSFPPLLHQINWRNSY